MGLLLNDVDIVWPGSSWNQSRAHVSLHNQTASLTSHNSNSIEQGNSTRRVPASDYILVPNGVDIHTHIGGGKANLTRLLMYERSKPIKPKFTGDFISSLSCPIPNTLETGQRYLELGYTACFEPAVLPSGARQAHAEMIDTPHLSTGGYVLLGNDEFLLERLSLQCSDDEVRDYVAWMLQATQCIAVKVVNAGGISAFKYNQREMDLDTAHIHWKVTPRVILKRLAQAIDELKLPHPLHVHCSNLGMPGNIATTLETLKAVDGHRIHLTHTQFHAYGAEGPFGFNSAAEQLADYVNRHPDVTIDVGQVFFGQTATLSADTMHQFRNRRFASPRKVIFQDNDCQAGCGVLPFKYREDQFVHGLQWAIGLELFLLVNNPYQVFLTTDHPNGAPFTAYPHLIKLLMSYDFRMEILNQLHPELQNWSKLRQIKREYTLEEVIIISRTGPTHSLGLENHFQLDSNLPANFTLFQKDSDIEKMFSRAALVVSNGRVVYDNGKQPEPHNAEKIVFRANLPDKIRISKTFELQWAKYNLVPCKSFRISDDELTDQGVLLR